MMTCFFSLGWLITEYVTDDIGAEAVVVEAGGVWVVGVSGVLVGSTG